LGRDGTSLAFSVTRPMGSMSFATRSHTPPRLTTSWVEMARGTGASRRADDSRRRTRRATGAR
jgi:hypothetical protein